MCLQWCLSAGLTSNRHSHVLPPGSVDYCLLIKTLKFFHFLVLRYMARHTRQVGCISWAVHVTFFAGNLSNYGLFTLITGISYCCFAVIWWLKTFFLIWFIFNSILLSLVFHFRWVFLDSSLHGDYLVYEKRFSYFFGLNDASVSIP